MSPRTFPRDTTAEILLLLPVKSLVRFKLVSSSWWSLISDPFFRRTHFNRAIQNPELCSQKALLSTSSRFMFFDPEESFEVDGNSVVDLLFPAETRHPHLRIVGSCNGLVCLVSSRSRDFFLWNPSTRDCNELPDACSPQGNRYAYGFGYDSFSDDYKVVLVTDYTYVKRLYLEPLPQFQKKVAIFSLKKNSWKIIREINEAVHNLCRNSFEPFPGSTFLNGGIHWRTRSIRDRNYNEVITAFDLAEEIFYLVPTPPHSHYLRYFNSGLGVLGGCLCLIYACFSDPYPFELWVMKEYGVEASWTKLCRLLNPDDTFLYGGHHLSVSHKVFYEPLCMCTSKENAFILIRSTKEVIRFNERGEVLEKVGICDDSDKCEGIAFVESIASVNHP
ncbi:hypothetical protein SLE2022_167170 [Rubroshorea leprosula]